MNRTQKFALNTITSMIAQIVVMIAGLITPRLMIVTYGSEINGLVSSLSQFILYITLVEAGIGGAAIYSLYKPLAQNDHTKISSIVTAARSSYRQAGYIFSAGLFILAVVYGLLSSSETLNFWTIFPLAILLGVNGCADFFFVADYRVLLTADQRNYIISLASIFNTVVRTVIICVLARNDFDIVFLYFLAAITAILKVLLILVYSKKKYSFIDRNALPDKGAMNKRWDVIYQQILGMIQSGAPVILATLLLSLTTVSVYSVYNMVIIGLNGILGVFISGLPAGFGDLIARNEIAGLKKSVSEFESAYYYMLSIVYGLAFVLIMPFISVYTRGLTDADYFYPLLGFVVVMNGVLYNVKTPQSMLIQSAGLFKETRWRVTYQGIIIIVAGLILGKLYGIVGIVVGSCISNLYRTIDLLIFVPKNITQLSIPRTAMRMLLVLINIGLISLPLIFFTISAKNYHYWIIYALLYGAYSVVVVTITSLLFDRKDFVSVVKRGLNLINGRSR